MRSLVTGRRRWPPNAARRTLRRGCGPSHAVLSFSGPAAACTFEEEEEEDEEEEEVGIPPARGKDRIGEEDEKGRRGMKEEEVEKMVLCQKV